MSFWSQISLQGASSVLMEPLDIFHDFSILFLEFILVSLFFATLYVSLSFFVSHSLSDSHLVESVWTIYPGLSLLFLGLPSLSVLYSMDCLASPSVSLSVLGHQWYWSYCLPEFSTTSWDSYLVVDPHNIRLLDVDNRCFLPFSMVSRVLVSSADVLHAWSLSSAALKVDATPGRVNQLSVSLTKAGLIYGQCSELCGPNHSFMPIVLESFDPVSF